MTPARGLSFFCDFPALPTCPISRPTSPSLPAVSILGFPTPRPFSPTNAQHAPHPNTLSSHPIFPHKKPGRFFPQASFPSLHTQQFPSLQPPLFPSPPRPRHSPASQRLSHLPLFPPLISPHKKPGGIPASGPTFPTFAPLWGLHFSAAGPPLTA